MERSILEMLSDRSSAPTLLGCRPSARKSLGRSQKRFQLLTKSGFCSLHQWFSNLSWGPPTSAYFVCLPHLTHLIQLISSLVESARLEMGVTYERDIQNVWWLGVPRTGLRTTALHHDNNHSFKANSLLNLSCPRRYVGSGPDMANSQDEGKYYFNNPKEGNTCREHSGRKVGR